MDDRHRQTDDAGWGAGYEAPVLAIGRRWTSPFVAVVGFALLVAVVKPWDLGGAGPRSSGVDQGPPSGAPGPVSASPAVVQGEDPAAEVTGICHNTDTWLLATVETSRRQEVRVLRVLPPSSDVRATDPRMPRLTFGSETVTELGWCAPVTGSLRSSGVVSAEAWLIVGGIPRPLVLDRDRPVGETASRFAALYRPPAGASVRVIPLPDPVTASHQETVDATPISWTSGSYIFRLRTADGLVESYALDVDIVPWRLPVRVTPSGAPTARPTPSP